uniref:Uncharacterized protein n=1 Tax=Tanacetum cinerariifolium TaxID=118510 RepID=A0A6L2L1K9_TANCI|nr:hypothetical protein [Tanacetum cinerariifolium]
MRFILMKIIETIDNIGEVVQSVESIAGNVVDVEQIQHVELGSRSSVGMVVDFVKLNHNVGGGSDVMSGDDAQRVWIFKEGILAMDVGGDAERVLFVVEDDLVSGEGETDENVKGKQEKDKIGTKPNKNGSRGKARQCRRPITVKNAKK